MATPQLRCREPGCKNISALGMFGCSNHLNPKPKGDLAEQSMGRAMRRYEEIARFGFVYALECQGFIKIGKANRPQERLSGCATGSPFKTRLLGFTPSPPVIEKLIHRLLVADRERGEWFRPTPAVLRVTEIIVAGDPDALFDFLEVNCS